jgi:muramidase (phage lysozyme)
MPVKAVFSVQVDDTHFTKFREIYDRWQTELRKQPQDWQKVAAAVGTVGQAHKDATKAIEQQTRALERMEKKKRAAEERSGENSHSNSTLNNWSKIANHAHNVDKMLERSTLRFAKWSAGALGLLGGLSAVGLVGSLFRIDRLAESVAAQRRSALGLGISYGQGRAYDTNYSRLVNAGGLMSNIATAKYDVGSEQYKALLAAGVSQRDIEKKNTAEIFSEFMQRLPALFQGVPKELTGTVAQQRGLNNLLPTQDIIAYLNASPEERAKIEERTRQDAKDMDLQDSVQRKWQDFITQLDRAKGTIESHLMDKLAVIEPGLEKVSDALVGVVSKLAKSGMLEGAINYAALEIDKFAGYVGTKEFAEDVKNFATWVGTAAKSIWDFISSFGPMAPGAQAAGAPSGSALDTGAFNPGDIVDSHGNHIPLVEQFNRTGGGGDNAPPDVETTAFDKTIPPEKRAFLDLIASGESKGAYNIQYGGGHFSSYAQHPGGGAAGRYQDLPNTWAGLQKKYGIPDFSPTSQDVGNVLLAQDDYFKKTGRDLWADVKSGEWERIKAGLQGTWVSWASYSPDKMKSLFDRALQRETEGDSALKLHKDDDNIIKFTPKPKKAVSPKPSADDTSDQEDQRTPLQQMYDAQHYRNVVIRSQTGASTPRSLFSVAQPFPPATQQGSP